MNSRVPIETFLLACRSHTLIDVRAPAEFKQGHIRGAISLPLFTNDERAVIGTLYKQKGKDDAMLKALDYYSPNMKLILEQLKNIQHEKKLKGAAEDELNTIAVHCWRGGTRSGVVCWMLNLFGYKTIQLQGGYKTYRNFVLKSFNKKLPIIILGGKTGSAKTLLLHELQKQKKQVIDLEGIAIHEGSSFGNMAREEQPTQEQFENNLSFVISDFNNENPVWIEDESQRIGHVNIPNELWHQMRNSKVYYLDIPFNERLEFLCSTYGKQPIEKLIEATVRIRKKLGGLQMQQAIAFLDQKNIKDAFEILLKYYDKLYSESTSKREPSSIKYLESNTVDSITNAKKVLDQYQHE